MPGHDLIVIGASAGGVQALTELVGSLPRDLPAAVLAVLHVGPGRSALPDILKRSGELPASHAKDGEPILPGRVYAAPPDCHLVVEDSCMRLERGPRENGHRPAVDVLFRSAAQAYRRRVIGVVLTGNLDDGTAGLLAIKRLGGMAVVQDPREADYPSMPRSAVENVPVDYVAPIAEMGPLLDRLAREPVPEEEDPGSDPPEGEEDSGVTDEYLGSSGEDTPGDPSGFTCPDCGGALWEWSEGQLVRFRCRTGHAYSPESLVSAQSDGVEAALWAAVRSLEERAELHRRLAKRMREQGSRLASERFSKGADEAEKSAAVLRNVLAALPVEVEAE